MCNSNVRAVLEPQQISWTCTFSLFRQLAKPPMSAGVGSIAFIIITLPCVIPEETFQTKPRLISFRSTDLSIVWKWSIVRKNSCQTLITAHNQFISVHVLFAQILVSSPPPTSICRSYLQSLHLSS